ncbi:MAG: ligand-binding protein SH3 [Candidatus Viridilinea halotolerans]|uniref:Ligand-binding protein SH3 n=1 Tax=Candidatus Viridilinea halotolerans TaxID=2491704 RepID=A0A426U455_9CHLR|nr:MAG: ligand-binding protein SH3 [Candidatus Viridilinea halotolerans]
MTRDQTTDQDAADAPLLFGRYRVSAQLGNTRWAQVYAASDERLRRRVLLHLFRKDLVGQERPRTLFLAEITQMAHRSHPALLEVFDSGEVGGRPFVVTEFCSGRPLGGLGLLTVEQALLYLRQITAAVATCQRQIDPALPQGLYHPPISSSNVLLVDEGQVRLVESWFLPPEAIQADQAHYRAPELSEGQPATHATAVYALGLLLYELLTGTRPVRGSDARATALAHLHARIPPLRQMQPNLYAPSLEALLARATERRPAERFSDAQSLGVALDSLWRELGAATRQLAPQRIPAVAPATPPVALPPTHATAAPRAMSSFGRKPRNANQRREPNALPWRKQQMVSNLLAWLLMTTMLVAVVGTSYYAVVGLVGGSERMPNPIAWISDRFGNSEIYVVNIAEGLNLRREPNAFDASNIVAVIPNGAMVRKLDGPRIEDNIPWLRVRAEVDGRPVEGWMSLNYLRPR